MNSIKSNKGMTLIEVLTVLFIMGMILLISYPLFNNTNEHFREHVVENQIKSIVHTAISESKRTSSYIDIKISTNRNLFIIEGEKTYETDFYAEADMHDEGDKIITINPKGIIEAGASFTFTLQKTSYEVKINTGRDEVTVTKL
ncbi:type II secretion system protein (plasmid) [Rossellomorea sp. AcN35-11]|nr:type II secretion system GspH family protein [Rossellomorea aquimaris]WJV32315.1 type II secretion system protein [Rossellomorea sp. AcN35-11]